jgi:hypothetical protein
MGKMETTSKRPTADSAKLFPGGGERAECNAHFAKEPQSFIMGEQNVPETAQ